MKTINIEDDMLKHVAICRSLKKLGITGVAHAKNAEDGLAMIAQAREDGNPYELLVLDMQFPARGVYDNEAGMYVIGKLKESGDDLPVIVCSSLNLKIPEAAGTIWYRRDGDLDRDMEEAVRKIRGRG